LQAPDKEELIGKHIGTQGGAGLETHETKQARVRATDVEKGIMTAATHSSIQGTPNDKGKTHG